MSNSDFTGVPLDELAAQIGEENFLMLRHAKLDYSHLAVAAQVIKHLVKCILVDSMLGEAKGAKTNKERYAASLKGLQLAKTFVQDAVADGFTLTFKEYAGTDMEYYCQIKDVPKPISKAIN